MRWQNVCSLCRKFDEALTDCISPFTEANGMSLYEKRKIDPHYGSLFQKAMTKKSQMLFAHHLEHYDGFGELERKTLVDVGGGVGTSLSIVVAKWPKLSILNCQKLLPPRLVFQVKHKGGNFFVSVPSEDAIMTKLTLNNWSDEDCLKILKICYTALPVSGNMIVMEPAVPLSPGECTKSTRASLAIDMYMIVYTKGGKERSEDEFRDHLAAAGFRYVQLVLQVNGLSVIEAEKT